MTTKPNTALGAGILADMDELERAAYESMSPIEKLNFRNEKQDRADRRALLDVQREQLDIAKAGHHLQTNAVTVAQAKMKAADDERDALVASRCGFNAMVEVRHTLPNVKGAPVVSVKVAVDGNRFGEGERGQDGSPRTGHFVSGVRLEDFAEAMDAIKASVLEPVRDQIEHFERAADRAGLDLLMKNLLGKGRADGLQHRFYTECRLPILRNLAGKTLEEIEARGAAKLIGEIVYDSQPLRATLDKQ